MIIKLCLLDRCFSFAAVRTQYSHADTRVGKEARIPLFVTMTMTMTLVYSHKCTKLYIVERRLDNYSSNSNQHIVIMS